MTEQPSGSVSVTALRQVRILSSLNDQQLAHLADQCTWSRCDGATEVLIQNTPCDQVYFVCNGRVSAKTFSGAGKEITFAELTSGDVFGELSALDGQPRSSFVVTVEESLLASLSAQVFNAFLDKHPQMMRSLMIELALRLRQADEKVFEFSTLSSGNRIHAELLRLARAHRDGDNSAQIMPAPTHADLASRTNTTRESVTRALNRLKKDGLIDTNRQCLTVHNINTLTILAQAAAED
jgi:CRP-like cAMP-binding protein